MNCSFVTQRLAQWMMHITYFVFPFCNTFATCCQIGAFLGYLGRNRIKYSWKKSRNHSASPICCNVTHTRYCESQMSEQETYCLLLHFCEGDMLWTKKKNRIVDRLVSRKMSCAAWWVWRTMLNILYCGNGNQGQLCGEYVVYPASADDLGTDLVALVKQNKWGQTGFSLLFTNCSGGIASEVSLGLPNMSFKLNRTLEQQYLQL